MNTTQTILEFFEKRKQEQHYHNLTALPEHLSLDAQLKWIIEESNLRSLKLELDIPYAEMYKEASALIEEFYSHRDGGEDHSGWKSLVIHGRGKHITQGDEQYPNLNDLPDYHWTEIADACPVTANWLKSSWPLDKFLRVRFMLLEPNGYIMPHRDNDKRKLQAINIALNNPEGCVFGMEGYGLIPWSPGDVRLIDISTHHAVWNNSNTPRIHIIVHGWPVLQYKEYRNLVIESYKTNYEKYISSWV
jgi:hypothetical protein